MAIPVSYTEATLQAYTHTLLGAVAATLGWTVALGSYTEPCNEAIAAYGVDDVTTILGRDNVRKIRALARREVWRAVAAQTASHYDVSADGASRQRSQIHAQALQELQRAELDCMEFDPAYEVGATTIRFDDAYESPADAVTP
jgi:hypothetical protein